MRKPGFNFALMILSCASVASTLASPAWAQTAWTISHDGTEVKLSRLGLETAKARDLGSLGSGGPGLLAANSTESFFFVEISPNPTLHRIDLQSVQRTEIGPLGAIVDGESLRGLTLGPNGRLWLCSELALFEVDTATGEATEIAPIASALEALAHDGDRLLGLGVDDLGRPVLFEINESTGDLDEIKVWPNSVSFHRMNMDVGPEGALWIQVESGVVIAPPELRFQIYRTDLTTGETELSGESQDQFLRSRWGLVVLRGSATVDVPTMDLFGRWSLIALLIAFAVQRISRR